MSKYNLMSTAIKPRDDGNYEYYENHLLIPHEAIRREHRKLENAVKTLDESTYRFQIKALKKWWTEFYAPVIHEHHNNEEYISFPYWEKLGNALPSDQIEDHKVLLTSMSDIGNLLDEMDKSEEGAADKFKLLQSKILNFTDIFLKHLTDEEKHWCELWKNKHTKKEVTIDEQNIVKRGLSLSGIEGEAFKMTFIAIMCSMGDDTLKLGDSTVQWCSDKYRIDFYKKTPWVARKLVFPAWFKRYHKWHQLIVSVANKEDIIESLFQQDQGGCHASCSIS